MPKDDYASDVLADEASFLLSNARGFLPPPPTEGQRLDDHLHHVAISLELALKAAARAGGYSDDYARTFIRHDLAEAAFLAERCGVRIERPLRRLISLLHPHYATGGFHRLDVRRAWPAHARHARRTVLHLLDAVERQMRTGELRRGERPIRCSLWTRLRLEVLPLANPYLRAALKATIAGRPPREAAFVAAFRHLPRPTRIVFVAHRVGKLTYPEIARLTGMRVRLVEAHIAEALVKTAWLTEASPSSPGRGATAPA
jgi:hypothetical protein